MIPTNKIEQTAIQYFRAYKYGFWHRGDRGEVYEWENNGLTICYRRYLQNLLKKLSGNGLPPLGTVLLVLAAAQDLDDNWDAENTFRTQLGFIDEWETRNTNFSIMTMYGQDALYMLNIIRSLPEKYRHLDNIHLLLETILDEKSTVLGQEDAQKAVGEYISGRLDSHIENGTVNLEDTFLIDDLKALASAFSRFPNTELVVTALRTGLTDVPDPADFNKSEKDKSQLISSILTGLVQAKEIKDFNPPETGKGDLIDELEHEKRTYGMARLTRRLMAAIRIPLHSRGSSDQPFGGVSDITNRGDFDRLLLSELAYDDTTLMARLANNEALYLRREEPPQDLIERRTLLIDTTIKMWGIPRVYAISAALACTITDQEDLTISAYALGGESLEALDLATKVGVIAALGKLDAALHCGSALRNWGAEVKKSPEQEVILVTSAEQMQSASFQSAMAEVRESLDYLITVSRKGQLQFFQYSGGRRKLLNQAMMNLEESLFAKPPVKPRSRNVNLAADGQMPAFYTEETAPMHFPTPGGRLDKKMTFAPAGLGVLTILPNRRVLYWRQFSGKAAFEVMPIIEVGEYTYGYDRKNLLSIMVSHKPGNFLKLYTYDTNTRELCERDMSGDITSWYGIRFRDGFFVLDIPGQEAYSRDYHILDPVTMALANDQFSGTQISDLVYKGWTIDNEIDMQQIKMATNQGYSMVKKIRSVSVSADGHLWVGKRVLNFDANRGEHAIAWKDMVNGAEGLVYSERVGKTESYDQDNSGEYFRRHVWEDGSQAIGDTRGFLHLISSDLKVPHISIAMIIGVPTRVWAQGKGAMGNSIFNTGGRDGDPTMIYQKYLQTFIDVILEKCS